jgi:hypothetical protein
MFTHHTESAFWIHRRASALCVRLPCVAGAALRALANRRWPMAGWVLGDHGPPGAKRHGRLSFEGMFPRSRMTAARRVAKPGGRRAARGSVPHHESQWAVARLARVRMPLRPGPWCSPSRPGWWRIPSPSATASGSPNHLLCPDPVRHMSVISGSAEPTIEYYGGLCRRLERVADAGSVGCSRRSARHMRTQH